MENKENNNLETTNDSEKLSLHDRIDKNMKRKMDYDKAKRNCQALRESIALKKYNPIFLYAQIARVMEEEDFYKCNFETDNNILPIKTKEELDNYLSTFIKDDKIIKSCCDFSKEDAINQNGICDNCPFKNSQIPYDELFRNNKNEKEKDIYQLEEFPLDTLPLTLQEVVNTLVNNINCPTIYITVSILVSIATAIGINFKVYYSDSWEIYSSLMAVLIGSPSSKKSPAMDSIKRILNDAEEKSRINVCVNNTTVEGACLFLSQNHKSILIACDELVAWLDSIGEYKKGKNTDRVFYLTSWNCEKYTVIRKTSQNIIIPKTHVNLLGSVQPQVLQSKWKSMNLGDGLIERILWVIPYDYKDTAKYLSRGTTPINKDVVDKYKNVLQELLSYNQNKEYTLDEKCNNILMGFEEETKQMTIKMPEHAAILGKIVELSGKFALIFQAYEDCENREYNNSHISEKNMHNSITITKYFLNQFIWIMNKMKGDSYNMTTEDKVYNWILDKTEKKSLEYITPSILSKNHVAKVKTANEGADILYNLVDEGRLYLEDSKFYIIK